MKNPLKGKKASREKLIREALQKSDIGAFKKQVERVYNAGGGEVQVLKSGSCTETVHSAGKIPLSELIGKPDMLEVIQEEKGDGFYNLKIRNADDVVESEHFFQIGPPKKTQKKKKGDEDSESAAVKGKDALLLKMFDRQEEGAKAAREQTNTMFGKLLEGKGDGQVSTSELLQIVVTTMSGSFDRVVEVIKATQPQDGESGMISAFMEGFHLRGEIQPKIEREDPMSTLLSQIVPLLGNLAAMKNASGAGDGNIVQKIQQALSAYSQSPAQQRSAATHPAPPGVSDAAIPAAGSPAPVTQLGNSIQNQTPIAASKSEAVSPAAGSQDYFYERYLAPFRRDIAAGLPDPELAYQLVKMIEYARDRMAGEPPPIMADFLTATNMMEADRAFYKFCAAIPEIATLRQKQEDLKLALITHFEFREPVTNVPTDHESFGETETPEGISDQDQATDAPDDPEDEHENIPG